MSNFRNFFIVILGVKIARVTRALEDNIDKSLSFGLQVFLHQH